MIEIIALSMVVFFGIFFLMILYLLGKTSVLFKESENVYRLSRSVNSKEGMIQLKSGHTWDISQSKPKILKWIFGSQPFYILDYNSIHPVEIKDGEVKQELMNPKMLNNLIKAETLKKFLTLGGLGKKEMLMWIIIGAALGFFAGIALVATGALPLNEVATSTQPAVMVLLP
jgi:hypothetical protein